MASLDDYLGSLRNAYGALDGRRLATLLDPLNNVQNHHIQQYLRVCITEASQMTVLD